MEKPGAAQLQVTLSDLRDSTGDGYDVAFVLEQTQKGGPLALDVPVVVQTTGKPVTTLVHMAGRLAATTVRTEAEPVALVPRAWFNPNLDSRNFFVPGVLALLVAVLSIILSSMSIVREREVGTMEQIMVTPIGRLEFILGKTIPFAIIGLVDVALIALIAVFWFRVPMLGFPPLLFLGTGLYLLSTLGVGLFISTVSSTQQQAMMTAFFFMLPAFMLSGFVYPIANMPRVVQVLTYLNPLRYYLVIIRGVFLKGLGLAELWPQMLALLLLGATMLLLAAGRFRKTMG